jgi:hypothetical protein
MSHVRNKEERNNNRQVNPKCTIYWNKELTVSLMSPSLVRKIREQIRKYTALTREISGTMSTSYQYYKRRAAPRRHKKKHKTWLYLQQNIETSGMPPSFISEGNKLSTSISKKKQCCKKMYKCCKINCFLYNRMYRFRTYSTTTTANNC